MSQSVLIDEQELKNTFEKAFSDVLKESIVNEQPDYNWLLRLFDEIRLKLCRLVPNNKSIQDKINEHMDIQLFEQMIINNAFTSNDLKNLVDFVFDMILKLQTPTRDTDTKNVYNQLCSKFEDSSCIFGEIVSNFVIDANKCIDFIYEDISKFCENNGGQ